MIESRIDVAQAAHSEMLDAPQVYMEGSKDMLTANP